jgi:hypothetical protein
VPRSQLARSRLLAVALVLFGLTATEPARAQTALLPPWELLSLPSPVVRVFTPPNGVLFALSSIGLSRSDDGGSSWTDVPLPDTRPTAAPPASSRVLGYVAVDPVDPLRLFARAADGIARTTDGGASWTTVLRPEERILAIAISPADPRLVYVTVGSYSSSYNLFRSQDGGDTWDVLDRPNYDKCAWWTTVLYPHPTDADRLFIASDCTTGRSTESQLQIRTNRGATVGQTYRTDRGYRPVTFAGGPPPGHLLMAMGDIGGIVNEQSSGVSILRSEDDGATWLQILSLGSVSDTLVRTPAATPVPNESHDLLAPIRFDVTAIAIGPADPLVAYVGIAQSMTVGRERSTPGRILRYSLETSSSGSRYHRWRDLAVISQGRLLDLAVSTDGQYLYAATDNGLWRLADPLHQPPR